MYDCNDDEESIVEETLLGESCGMLVHKAFPLCLKLVKYMSPNPVDLISTPVTCSSPSPSHEHYSPGPTDYRVMWDLSLDLGHVNNFFHMLKENMLDVI